MSKWARMLLVLLPIAATAADWPQWRGPNRDGVASQAIALLQEFPKEGPKKLWESEPIPGGDGGGCSQPVVAGERVFVFANTRLKKQPVPPRGLTKDTLAALGWKDGIPPDLATRLEDARVGEMRSGLKENAAVVKWADEWIKANLKPEEQPFQAVTRMRLIQGSRALALTNLTKLVALAGQEYADHDRFDERMKAQGLDDATRKQLMAKLATPDRSSSDTLYCLNRVDGKTVWKKCRVVFKSGILGASKSGIFTWGG